MLDLIYITSSFSIKNFNIKSSRRISMFGFLFLNETFFPIIQLINNITRDKLSASSSC